MKPANASSIIGNHGCSLTAVSENTPLITSPADAEVDIEILRSVPKQFEVNDDKSANWLVKKIIAAREYAERVKRWADAEQLRAYREEQTLMFLFGRQIEAWAKCQIEGQSGGRKSVALPAGTVGYHTQPIRLVVDDESRVISWAKENLPTAIIVVEKLSKSVLNEYTVKTGKIPDGGVHVEPAAEKFFIR